ncbi:ATP-binding protein [Thaumasiovibrio subtropicus]|uniref:ATP-binding protein n=1 Tax=Thaumasiovibrio subtropicus TaxID=1891207 RepID=UPI000B364A73|nr:ATP-binding protein [Thaumasiovibrio subtropicus]
MKKRHSIATRIFALFVLLGSLAIGLVITNALTLQNLTRASESWVEEQLPILVSAAKFAEQGGQITTAATNLALATNTSGLNKAHQDLQKALPRLTSIDPKQVSVHRQNEIHTLANALSDNIDQIYTNTQQKLIVQQQQRQTRQQLYWMQIDFVDEVIPLSQESQFNLGLLMEKLKRRQQLTAEEFARLNTESNTQTQLLKLEADVNLVLDLLQRVSLFDNRTDILAAQSMIDETVVAIAEQIDALAPLPSTVTIRQIALQLNEFITGQSSTINKSLKVLALDEGNQSLLAENQAMVQRMGLIVTQAVDNAERQATSTAIALSKQLSESRFQLNFTLGVIIVLVIFVAVFLRTQLLNRLEKVLRSMRHLAQGELQQPITIKGQDEVASLARATNVFNETAKQLRQRTQDLEEKNNQLLDEILQRQQAEMELKETQEELVQAGKLAVLGQLTTGIVHEFSQPLAAIRSNTYLANQYLDQHNSEKTKEKLNTIDRITERATRLCQHLKSFARKSDDEITRTPLRNVIIDAIDLFTDKLPKPWYQIEVEPTLSVVANPVRLEQVLVNLISNSLDAIQAKQGNTEQPARYEPHLQIRATRRGDTVQIHIIDNGCGMNEAQLTQIFEPFFTTKDVGNGLGLGMSITHNIIQDFGGTIQITSSPQVGTEVTLCLKSM